MQHKKKCKILVLFSSKFQVYWVELLKQCLRRRNTNLHKNNFTSLGCNILHADVWHMRHQEPQKNLT